MQVIGRDKTMMRWLKHRGGAQHHQRWKQEKREPLPAAAVIGADPGTILAAVTPVPDTLSEYHFAGLLRGRKVDLVDCKTVPLKVPAEAEIVLEGHVSLDETAEEGPYGDHTGYYNAAEPFPTFTVTAVTMRRDPIYLSTFTGRPPDEPSILGEGAERGVHSAAAAAVPGDHVDFWLPPEGCSYRVAVVAMKKAYPGHAKRVMMGVWSYLRQFMYTKWVIVVDHERERAGLEGRDLGGLHQDGSGPRHHGDRAHADRLPRLCLARRRSGLQDRPRRHRQMAAGNKAGLGPGNPYGSTSYRPRRPYLVRTRPARFR